MESLDPVLRCDSCQALVKRATLHKHGSCHKCGNKRIRNVTVFDDAERKRMKRWGFHAFVADFVAVSDE